MSSIWFETAKWVELINNNDHFDHVIIEVASIKNVKDSNTLKKWVVPNSKSNNISTLDEAAIASEIMNDITLQTLRRRKLYTTFEGCFDNVSKQIIKKAIVSLFDW